MSLVDNNDQAVGQINEEVTLESLATRLDALGAQMDWLCENLASLFQFVTAVGSSGGGIRGLMKAMKSTPEVVAALEQEGQKDV